MRVLRPRLTSCSIVVLVLLGAHPFATAAPRPLEVLDHGGTEGRTPTAIASADFDEDGMRDLVMGYSSEYGGAIAVHRGNVDAVYPHAPAAQRRRAEGTFVV